MNVKHRALVLVTLVILCLSAFLLHEGISHFNTEINTAIQEQEKFIDGVTTDIKKYAYGVYRYKIKYFVDEHEGLRKAFAEHNRELLYRLCLPDFNYFRGENPYFHAMDFNLPDGTVFLRVQNSKLFGDNIGESREIVSAVHLTHEPRAGFDVGKHGAIYWVVQPVFFQDKYIGAVEFGIEVKQLEQALATTLGSEVTSLLRGNQWQKAELVKEGFREYGDFILMTRGETLFDRIVTEIDFSHLGDQQIDIDRKPYILHCCSLLEDYKNDRIGRLVLFQDISGQVARKKAFILHTLLLTAAVLVASIAILYWSFGGLIGRLEEYAIESKKAKEELQKAHDKMEDRVKERTVDLAMANARLEDEVTIRSRTETRLDEQRAFLETIIESLTHPFYVIDTETYEIVLANQAACDLTDVKKFNGLTCYAMTHHAQEGCSGENHPCPLEKVKETGKPVRVEHVHYDQLGNEQFVEIFAYPVFNRYGNISRIVEYIVDISDRKKSEKEKEQLRDQLLTSQKMEAIGMLADGVAHDFSNILTTILGYSQIMALKLQETDPMRDMTEEIYDAAERATGLVHQLLAFSRKQAMEMKVVNLNTIIENISKLLGRLIGENIRMRLNKADSLGNIKADIGQIEQVIMNLVVNARDAMPDGGELTIETAQIALDENYAATHHGVQPGKYAMITVTDTGIGMSRDVQEKIFEPFFTTKEQDEGSGLGLATVYGIVQQHEGHIYVYSEPDRGTTFKIYFPLVEGEAKEIAPRDDRSMPVGNETVMIVDDDASIRKLIRDTLEPLGYTIIEAGSGEDALALLAKTDGKIDLVLTDLIMPGMNGQELINTLVKGQPEIKSILMSGYTANIVGEQDKPWTIFLNKPLLPVGLSNTVRDVLDGKVRRSETKQNGEG